MAFKNGNIMVCCVMYIVFISIIYIQLYVFLYLGTFFCPLSFSFFFTGECFDKEFGIYLCVNTGTYFFPKVN